MVSLAANYTRIRISKELTEYRDAVDLEELDLHSSADKSSQQYWHKRRWLDQESRLVDRRYDDRDDIDSEYSDDAFDDQSSRR